MSDDFDNAVIELAEEDGVRHIIMNIPGVWEHVSEYYNNEALRLIEEEEEEPTLYRTEAPDGTLRMSLHPMEHTPPVWDPDEDEEIPNKPGERFPFRVVFKYPFRGMERQWRKSCRGEDAEGVGGQPLGSFGDVWADSEDKAIAWLKEGEDD